MAVEALRVVRNLAVAAVVLYALTSLIPPTRQVEEWLVGHLSTAPWTPSAVTVANVVALYGPLVLLVSVPTGALLIRRDWRVVWVLSVPAMGSFAMGMLLVGLLPRTPGAVQVSHGASYPSPVVALVAALAVVAAQLMPTGRNQTAARIGMLVIGAMGVFLCAGLWYRPMDVVGGALLGGIVAIVVIATHASYIRQFVGVQPTCTDASHPIWRWSLLFAAVACAALLAVFLSRLPGVDPASGVAGSVVVLTGIVTGILTRLLTRAARGLVLQSAEKQERR